MNNARAIYTETIRRLAPIYGENEASSLVRIIFEDLLQLDKMVLFGQEKELNPQQISLVESAATRLLNHEPVQHIVGFGYFLDRKFRVNQHTLIPRPETEELVMLVAKTVPPKAKILDIGTGSGCIAISLALALPFSSVSAWDISAEALNVANENARLLGAKVLFALQDILAAPPATFDVVVSNPPYIPQSEAALLDANVTQYEPGLALFVPNSNPLLFYRAIAQWALQSLTAGGMLFFEVHEQYGHEVGKLLKRLGYQNVEVVKDLNGKERMVRADARSLK